MRMNRLHSYIQVIAGCVLTAISFAVFIIPYGFACGGITGLGVLISSAIPVKLSVIVMILNTLLFLSGWFCIGSDFVLKTALTCVLFPLALDLFSSIALPSVHALTACVIAGILLGAGTAMVINGNGSCCGFDIIGVIFQKYFRIPASYVINICSTAVILLQFTEMKSMILGILVIMICTAVMNIMMREEETVPDTAQEM